MNIDPVISYIICVMIGFSIGLFTMVIKNCYEESKENEKNMRIQLKNHKIDLRDKGLTAFKHMEIKRDDFSVWKDVFEVKIDGLNKIEGERVYEHIIQHLKEYPNIEGIWNNSKNKVDELNIALKNLISDLLEKINFKFDKEQNKLRSLLLVSIEWANSSEKIKESKDLDKFLDEMNIYIENNEVCINSDITKNPPICKTFRKLDTTIVSNFLSNLIKKDKVFRDKIKGFTIGYKELKKTFDNNFKNKVNELLREIKDDVDKLKGECDRCELLVKEIG